MNKEIEKKSEEKKELSFEEKKQMEHGKLMAKMAKVIEQTGSVEKKGQNKEQGYKFATHSDIIQELRKHIVENKLFILPKPDSFETAEVTSQRGAHGSLITMKVDFEIIDIETGYSILVRWFGQGLDYGDKAIYKSYTGALKYFLLDTFMISTGDDPENDSQEGARPKQPIKSIQQPYQQPYSRSSENGNGGLISMPQINYIRSLLKKKGYTEKSLLSKYEIADLKELTHDQASTAITGLSNVKPNPNPKPEPIEEVTTGENAIDVDEVDKGIEEKNNAKNPTSNQ